MFHIEDFRWLIKVLSESDIIRVAFEYTFLAASPARVKNFMRKIPREGRKFLKPLLKILIPQRWIFRISLTYGISHYHIHFKIFFRWNILNDLSYNMASMTSYTKMPCFIFLEKKLLEKLPKFIGKLTIMLFIKWMGVNPSILVSL